MPTEEPREQETTDVEERVSDAAGNELRRAFRRKLPFGRGAVLVVGARTHIVGLADLSVTGAYISTRAPVSVGDSHVLRLLLLPETVELRAQVVRVVQADVESNHHPRGVAVRFLEPGEKAMGQLKAFIARALGGKP